MFDKVLVDAPCSGECMQYKSDKKIWQWDEKKSRKLSELQTQLLIS
jgi:16S rRNA C967 or C1407 C5-methylase (RsmB/RsmF family)